MIENVMHHIGGVGVFGVISISIFFAFFTGMLLWAGLLKKPYLKSMQSLPLESGPEPKASSNPAPICCNCNGRCKNGRSTRKERNGCHDHNGDNHHVTSTPLLAQPHSRL